MEEKNYEEILSNNIDIISLLMNQGAREFTDKVTRNEDYDIKPSFMFYDKFKPVIDLGLITSFALKAYINKQTQQQFCMYKIAMRIPTNEGLRYFELEYGVGYKSKMEFERLREKLDTDHLPLEWLKKFRIDTKIRKADNKEFKSAEIIGIDKLSA